MQTFDLTVALPQRTTSANTQRAYYRWVDRFLVDVAGLKATGGVERIRRMENLPLKSLIRHLTARKLKNWLDRLVEEGHGRQSLDQARASIVTLCEMLAEVDLLDTTLSVEIQNVSVPSVRRKEAAERLLTPDEVKRIMVAARDMATSTQQTLRNNVVATMLCTMALRREELSSAKWGDLTVLPNGVVGLRMSDGGYVDMPRPVLAIIDRWRNAVDNPLPESPLIRRIWKGGRISKEGLSPDGIWLIIRDASVFADLGHVTPDDLRRSAVASMHRNGMPTEELSRLLRHRNVLITERFLARLPREEKTED